MGSFRGCKVVVLRFLYLDVDEREKVSVYIKNFPGVNMLQC